MFPTPSLRLSAGHCCRPRVQTPTSSGTGPGAGSQARNAPAKRGERALSAAPCPAPRTHHQSMGKNSAAQKESQENRERVKEVPATNHPQNNAVFPLNRVFATGPNGQEGGRPALAPRPLLSKAGHAQTPDTAPTRQLFLAPSRAFSAAAGAPRPRRCPAGLTPLGSPNAETVMPLQSQKPDVIIRS